MPYHTSQITDMADVILLDEIVARRVHKIQTERLLQQKRDKANEKKMVCLKLLSFVVLRIYRNHHHLYFCVAPLWLRLLHGRICYPIFTPATRRMLTIFFIFFLVVS